MVRGRGLEPPRHWTHAPQTCLSAGSSTLAYNAPIIAPEKELVNPFLLNGRHFFTVRCPHTGSPSGSTASSRKLTGRKPSLQESMAERLFFIHPS